MSVNHDSGSGLQPTRGRPPGSKLIESRKRTSATLDDSLSNRSIEWLESDRMPGKKLLHISGFRFDTTRDVDGDKWFYCANQWLGTKKCKVRARLSDGKLVSLIGTHFHAPHVGEGSVPDSNRHDTEIPCANGSGNKKIDHRPSLVRRTIVIQGSKSSSQSRPCQDKEEPEWNCNHQNLREPNSKDLSLDKRLRTSNLSILSTVSEQLKLARSKPVPMSIRVKVLEKELEVKEVTIKTLVEELCIANELIQKLEDELRKSKESNG
ncbi:hypothetical protein HDE_07919 [Halotydeus destructor]|nr:hypothetical protein HDE_07919 [Halotydeus destructor]